MTREEIDDADSLDELSAIQMDLQSQYEEKIEKIGSFFEAE